MEKIRLRACALIIKDGAILLVEYENDNDDRVHFNLPAGGLELGETFVEAVKREAKEEASVDVEVGSVGYRFRSFIRFNCTQKLTKTSLITSLVTSIAIMLKNKRYNIVSC